MNFSTDRDLLALEPTLFHDVPWVGQQRLTLDDAIVVATTVTSANADFIAAQIEAGSVVLIRRVPYEVVSRQDANTLSVSLLRARLSDDPLPGTEGGPFELIARTFSPQASQVHDTLLRIAGIHDDADPDHALDENAIVSLSVMVRLETLGTLERIYSAAATIVGDNHTLTLKANDYRRRFREAINTSSVLIDTNGDGHPDERRRLGVLSMNRI